MVARLKDLDKAKAIFGDWEETIIYSCVQGVMGDIYVDDEINPKSAMAILGDFCLLGGVPNSEVAMYKPENFKNNFIIMVPQNDEWARLIEQCYGYRAKSVIRYAIKKEKDIFDVKKLESAVASLPEGFKIKMIDEDIYNAVLEEEWSKYLVLQFDSYDIFKSLGIGVVAMYKDDIVAGASSYSRYKEGIEIEIDTKEEYRRKGLAYACGAKLILECLKRGLYPSWDAQNKWSVGLAQKLGYTFDHEYCAFEMWDY